MNDYFVENPKFNANIFRQRFCMSKSLFLKIVSDVEANNEWFQEGLDGRMKKSFTPLQKVTSAIKQLAAGNPPDENDEYLNMAERTSRECLEYFCETVCKMYAGEFLRRQTSHDVIYERRSSIPDSYVRGGGVSRFVGLACFLWPGGFTKRHQRAPTISVISYSTKGNGAKLSISGERPLIQTRVLSY
ncbi:hypothetical protein HanIR_Chr14g0727321 [Helianthus annuus]|nr:hypothetical protein HanIR_Chr14g0727321 [Helianthus annuus]